MVSVATWNVQNLFRPGTDAGPDDPAEYETKLDALASTIDAAGAEVWALQEVGGPEALGDLVDRLDGTWYTRLSTHPDHRGIRVAFGSQLPMSDVVEVVDLPPLLQGGRADDSGAVLTRLGRGALQVTVDAGTRALRIVTCHLKSKLLTYPGGRFWPRDEDERARYGVYALNRRAAEAGALRIHANALLDPDGSGDPVILLGDLNDGPDAATTQLLYGPGGSQIGTGGYPRPDQGDQWRLWNLAPLIPEDSRYSRIYRGQPELIDQILVSHALLDSIVEVRSLVEHPVTGMALRSIGDQPDRQFATGSDHAPIIATFSD